MYHLLERCVHRVLLDFVLTLARIFAAGCHIFGCHAADQDLRGELEEENQLRLLKGEHNRFLNQAPTWPQVLRLS